MEKIIGLPKGFNYYRDEVLYKNFFEKLGFKVLVSPDTNKQTINEGSKYLVDEACLSIKIFMGHVAYLKDKCDYVLVPRINSVKKRQKVCTNFTAIYDICKNVFPSVNFLDYNLDVNNRKYEKSGFIKMAKKLGCSKKNARESYLYAKKIQCENYKKKMDEFTKKINSPAKIKILLVGHPYNINDSLIESDIKTYFESEDVLLLKSDIYNLDYDEACAKKISSSIYWTYNRELFSIVEKYKDKVDGIILLSMFPCGPDSLCNELIVRSIKNKPILTLIIDSVNSNAGLITRLESFIDIIKTRKDRK